MKPEAAYSIIKFSASEKEYADLAFYIRKKVFVEEQHVPADEEYDQYDENANHYLVMIEGIAAGTSRWRITENGIKLERFAVLPEFRNRGAATALIKRVLDDVSVFNKNIYLHAQLSAVDLYLKNGFESQGELFYEANIPHFKMIYINKADI